MHSSLMQERLSSILTHASKGHALGCPEWARKVFEYMVSYPRLLCERGLVILLKTSLEDSACQYHVCHCSFAGPKGWEQKFSSEGLRAFRDPLYLKMMMLSPRGWFLCAFWHVWLFPSNIRVLLGTEIS